MGPWFIFRFCDPKTKNKINKIKRFVKFTQETQEKIFPNFLPKNNKFCATKTPDGTTKGKN